MFKPIKWLIGIVVMGLIAYFIFRVPLGRKTTWEHLVGISRTDEAKTFGKELGKKVEGAGEEISRELKKQATKLASDQKSTRSDGEAKTSGETGSAQPKISKKDRESLQKLIENKEDSEPNDQDRRALDRLLHEKNR